MSAPVDTESLLARDRGRLLWHLAHAGAQVRRADEVGAGRFRDWDPDRLDLGGPPRSVLVATDEPTSLVADLLTVLAAPVAPVSVVRTPQLPRFAGAADAAVVVSLDGRHPRLVALTAQAARRGCSLLVVAPAGSPVAAAAGRGVVVDLPADTPRRAAGWTALGPVLIAAGRWGLTTVGPRLLTEIADALDDVAHSCRPDADAFANPARSLAEEFTEAQPVLVGAGPLSAVAADRFASALRLFAGSPAVALHLPEDVAQATAVFVTPGGRTEEDFFRDRVDEPVARPRVVLIGSEDAPDDPGFGVPDAGAEPGPSLRGADEREAFAAARVVTRAAEVAGVRASTLDTVPGGDPLVRWAVAVQLGLFTAAYLALLRDLDPSAPQPGEMT
ncbi:SIS domain-containing protein [Jatrophihabitans sp. YIM 134969]